MKTYTIDELKKMSYTHPVIAFDGVCNMCNGFINWLIKRDGKRMFRYTTLQSDTGKTLEVASGTDLDSVILVWKGRTYTHSDVSLVSMRILGGAWSILSWLTIIPKIIRDGVYNTIARNRYKWFGEKEACMIPSPEVRSLFL